MRLSPMMLSLAFVLMTSLAGTDAFVPTFSHSRYVTAAPQSTLTSLFAKVKTIEEILAKFPEDKPVLINFYDAKTEAEIKDDILRAKNLLADRATLVSIKQQDYPELAKLWDADEKSPSMILFKDGRPVVRLYEETHYLEIAAKVRPFVTPAN